MSQITTRIYKDENDIQIAIDLIARVRSFSPLDNYPNRADIEESLASRRIRANTRLWFDKDQPIGWAYVDEFNNLWWQADPHYEESIGTQIVEWGETCVRRTLSKAEVTTLDTSCREDNIPRLSFIEKHGFQRADAITIFMIRPLFEPIPEPKLPQGFVIRSVTGLEEAEAIASTHRAAFGT